MKRMRIPSLVPSLFLASLSLAAFGCSASTAANDPTASATLAQTTTSTAPVAPQVKGHLRVVADALSQVPLRADQRAEIEQMAKDAEARHAAHAAAHAQVMQALAAQVEAGKIDRAALQPSIDAATSAADASRPADRAALTRLHDLLTPQQRAQFVEALKSHVHERMGEHPMHSHMEAWAADLKLSDDQLAQIKTALHAQMGEHTGALHEGHEKGKAILESFKSDTFALPPPEDLHGKVNGMVDHVVNVARDVLPILTPEQRSLAAAKLRERAAAGGDEAFGE
jgi:Spy/CpxP family protein refolding chaperone